MTSQASTCPPCLWLNLKTCVMRTITLSKSTQWLRSPRSFRVTSLRRCLLTRQLLVNSCSNEQEDCRRVCNKSRWFRRLGLLPRKDKAQAAISTAAIRLTEWATLSIKTARNLQWQCLSINLPLLLRINKIHWQLCLRPNKGQDLPRKGLKLLRSKYHHREVRPLNIAQPPTASYSRTPSRTWSFQTVRRWT